MAELQVLHNKAARSILDLPARPSLGRLRSEAFTAPEGPAAPYFYLQVYQ